MDSDDYIATVHEQLLAYGYQPLESPSEGSPLAVYEHPDRLSKQWKDAVTITALEDSGVAQVKEASDKAREVVKQQVGAKVKWWGNSTRVAILSLMICPTITRQMEIFVEEGHKTADSERSPSTESWLFPVLVDLEEERIVHRKSTKLKKYYMNKILGNRVKKLFQL